MNTLNQIKSDRTEEAACRYTVKELASCKIGTWEKLSKGRGFFISLVQEGGRIAHWRGKLAPKNDSRSFQAAPRP